MRLFEIFKEKNKIIIENEEIKKNKKKIENENQELLLKIEDISCKYINLLEQKSASFDLYLDYQSQCVGLANEKRELKKQLAESKETVATLIDDNANYKTDIDKLNKKITRLEKNGK